MNALNRDRQKSKHIESERFPKTFSSAKLCNPLQNPVDFLGTRFYHLLNVLRTNVFLSDITYKQRSRGPN